MKMAATPTTDAKTMRIILKLGMPSSEVVVVVGWEPGVQPAEVIV